MVVTHVRTYKENERDGADKIVKEHGDKKKRSNVIHYMYAHGSAPSKSQRGVGPCAVHPPGRPIERATGNFFFSLSDFVLGEHNAGTRRGKKILIACTTLAVPMH
jgi:hypothetical protein